VNLNNFPIYMQHLD